MADKQVIRQDVVQISWEVEESPLKKMADQAKSFQTKVGQAVDNVSDGFKSIGEEAQSSSKLVKRLQSDIEQADAALAKVKATAASVKAGLEKCKTAASKMLNALKPSNVLEKLHNKIDQIKNSIASMAKQKLTKLQNNAKALVNTFTGGKKGVEGFKNVLKNVAKISFSELVNGVKNIGSKIKTAGTNIKTFGSNVKTAFTNAVSKGKTFVSTLKQVVSTNIGSVNDKINSIAKSLGTNVVAAAKKAATAIAAIGVGAATGSFKLADMASDLSETINKVDVSFGKNSGSVMEWSKNSIKSMGLSQQTALDMAALFGDMGTGMGISQKKSANMSMELTQLGADLASFKNMDIEEVTTALNGVFTGETESLKRLGVVMTQTNLEAFALSQGLKTPIDEMSESEKVMLRYNYVLSKTKNAQGDFERTGGGFANQLRMAKEQLKQIGTTIGGVFIGSFEGVLNKVNDFGTKLNTKLSEVLADGFQFSDISKIAPIFGDFAPVIQTVANKIQTVINKVKEFTSNSEKMAAVKSIFSSIKSTASTLIGIFERIIAKIWGFLTSMDVLDALKKAFEGIKKVVGWVSDNFDWLAEVVTSVVIAVGIFIGVVKTVNAVMKVWQGVQLLVNSGLLACPITWIVAAIIGLIAIIVLLVRNWDKVKETATKCWGKIKEVWGGVKDWFNTKVVQPVKKFFNELWNKLPEPVQGVVEKIFNAFKWAYDKITGAWSGISSFFSGIWEDAVKAIAKPVNKIIGGANWVLEKLGSDKVIAEWQPYARGTAGHPGGNAIVNDGRGAELVQFPNGRTFIPSGRNVLMPNAPKGMKVLSAENTARVMGRTSPTFNYEGGIGSWDIWSFFDDAKGLVKKVIEKFISYDGMAGYALDVGKALVSKATTAMGDWIKGLFSKLGGKDLASYEASEGVNQWRSTVIQALKMEGQYTAENLKKTLYQMQTESGGNPKAINNWDSNAKKGTPSKGLMQVIDPTFKAYARKGYDTNIYDPLSNVLASVRYAVDRYGTLSNAYKGVGYANGIGTVRLPSYSPASSVPVTGSTSSNTNNYSPSFNLTMNGTVDRTTERTVKKWIKEALQDTFDGMGRTNPRLTEV